MTTSTPKPATYPFAIEQADIADRIERYVQRRELMPDPIENRHYAAAHCISRETAREIVDGDAVDPETDGLVIDRYPEDVPTRKSIVRAIAASYLPSATKNVLALAQALDHMSEFLAILGHGDIADQLVPDVHAPEVEQVMGKLVAVAKALQIPVDPDKIEQQDPDTVGPAHAHVWRQALAAAGDGQ